MNDTQSAEQWFQQELEDLKDDHTAILEGILLDLVYQIADEMDRKGISKSELARRIDRPPSFVTRFLNGHDNMTLSTVVRVGRALGLRFEPQYVPEDSCRATNRRKRATSFEAQAEDRYKEDRFG